MDPASARLGGGCGGRGGLGPGAELRRARIPRRPPAGPGASAQRGPREEGWGRYQRFCPSSSSPAAAPPLPEISSLAKEPPV